MLLISYGLHQRLDHCTTRYAFHCTTSGLRFGIGLTATASQDVIAFGNPTRCNRTCVTGI
ncbi:MAG: hypothetical protein H5U19_14310 [Rhodobacteraceae bacterium]|nr:hypothetical protein [Paracoccaceae bacterium]